MRSSLRSHWNPPGSGCKRIVDAISHSSLSPKRVTFFPRMGNGTLTPVTVVKGMEKIYADDVRQYPNLPPSRGASAIWTVTLDFHRDPHNGQAETLRITASRAWRDARGRLHAQTHRREVPFAFPSDPIDGLRSGISRFDGLLHASGVPMSLEDSEDPPWRG